MVKNMNKHKDGYAVSDIVCSVSNLKVARRHMAKKIYERTVFSHARSMGNNQGYLGVVLAFFFFFIFNAMAILGVLYLYTTNKILDKKTFKEKERRTKHSAVK
jgi:hypothetical protein